MIAVPLWLTRLLAWILHLAGAQTLAGFLDIYHQENRSEESLITEAVILCLVLYGIALFKFLEKPAGRRVAYSLVSTWLRFKIFASELSAPMLRNQRLIFSICSTTCQASHELRFDGNPPRRLGAESGRLRRPHRSKAPLQQLDVRGIVP